MLGIQLVCAAKTLNILRILRMQWLCQSTINALKMYEHFVYPSSFYAISKIPRRFSFTKTKITFRMTLKAWQTVLCIAEYSTTPIHTHTYSMYAFLKLVSTNFVLLTWLNVIGSLVSFVGIYWGIMQMLALNAYHNTGSVFTEVIALSYMCVFVTCLQRNLYGGRY